jgi:ribonuclease PH
VVGTSERLVVGDDVPGAGMSRHDGRAADELRPLDLLPGFVETAAGSVLFSIGRTRVICTATVQESVPRWMAGKGTGWVTAEYGMLPASTGERKPRDSTKGRPDGRTVEIQRLIGRSLRGVVDFAALGERTVWIDCDVLQADGGTRCAAISGGFVAMQRALAPLVASGKLAALPFNGGVAAVSAGVVDGTPVLDLDYHEDSNAEVDMNVVMVTGGRLIEIQGTAEGQPFDRTALDALLELAASGITRIEAAQRIAAATPGT